MLRKGLLLLLFVMLLKTDVFAGEINGRVVYFYENVHFSETAGERSFFLFSNIVFEQAYMGDIFLFNSYAEVTGNFTGNIYCFYSNAGIGGSHAGQIYDLTSPFLVIPFKVFIFLIIFSSKKSFFEQCSVTLLYSPFKVLRYGLLAYFFCIALACMFLLSVVGFPISLLILAVSYVLTVLGEISLSILVGYAVLRKTKQTFSYASMIAGAIIIEMIGYVPAIGAVFDFLPLPILCLGILSCGIVDGYINKSFYNLPYLE